MRSTFRCLVLVVVPSLASMARAQWNVIRLHPPGAGDSNGYGIGNGQQVGDSDSQAVLWTGTASSIVHLGPASATTSNAYATDGMHQVGRSDYHACVWSGTASSFVDLDPGLTGAVGSVATGVSGGVQVGTTNWPQSVTRAAMWMGSAASYVDLSPPGSTSSAASSIDGGQIVGGATIAGISQAGFWTGTAGSFVGLNPPGVTVGYCYGVHSGTQVGYVRASSGQPHASLWHSTSASWVDLHPPALSPSAYTLANGVWVSPAGVPHVVGEAQMLTGVHACYWNDTPSSWVDLSPYLPEGWWNSSATGVWSDNQNVYVVGYAQYESYTFEYEAFLWWRPIQSPIASYCLGDGSGTACPCANDAPVSAGGGCRSSFNGPTPGAKLVGSGDPSLANDTFVLRASAMPESQCLFFQGTNPTSAGLGAVFGDGLRCASGVVTRLLTKPIVGSQADYPVGAEQAISVRGSVLSPGLRTYQAWYRDAAVFCSAEPFNLTNGLSVIWSP